jgi:hypothetical protein
MCGGVRFEVAAPSVSAGYCHCTRCRRRTGTAAGMSAQIEPGSLRVVAGEELIRAWEPPDGFAKLFCSVCGSGLFARNPASTEVTSVRMGAFDADPGIRPSYHQFVAYAAEWEEIRDDGLPRYPERRP